MIIYLNKIQFLINVFIRHDKTLKRLLQTSFCCLVTLTFFTGDGKQKDYQCQDWLYVRISPVRYRSSGVICVDVNTNTLIYKHFHIEVP